MSDYATRSLSALPMGTGFSRYLHALTASRGDTQRAQAFAQRWRDSPQVSAAFEFRTKAAVGAGTTTDATWAKPLVTTGLAAEAISLLRGLSIVGQLEPRLRRVEFGLQVPMHASTVMLGGWIAEGLPIPVAALNFSTVGPLEPTKVAVITALTKELLTLGTPNTEAMVRQDVLGGLAALIDQSFLLPTSVAAAGRPAAVTAGAVEVTSTGATAAAIAADLGAMLASITTSGGNLVWVMRPTTRAKVAAALGSTSGLPATLHGIPVVVSKNSPQQVTLLDGDAILLAADDNGFDVSLSESSTIQMDSVPANPVAASTVMTSFFQSNLVGVRAVRVINWLRVVDGSVVFMTTAY